MKMACEVWLCDGTGGKQRKGKKESEIKRMRKII